MRILIVDDSVVFRSQIKLALNQVPSIQIAGTAAHGKICLEYLKQDPSIDLITLDLEMPEMDGVQTLKEIQKLALKTKVIIFYSQTVRGVANALEALRLGAHDIVAKPQAEGLSIDAAADAIKKDLIPKVLQFAEIFQKGSSTSKLDSRQQEQEVYPKKSLVHYKPKLIVIGSSTGGPVALEAALKLLKPPIAFPILIAQHMPPLFTKTLSERIEQLVGIPCHEGKNNETLCPNRIYVAPGDYHMSLIKIKDEVKVRLDQRATRNSVRPSVDYLFESASQIFGPDCLGVILTGMGEDGLQGAKAIKNAGGPVIIQSKESCVVFGMPGAVFQSGAYDQMGDLNQIAQILLRMT